MKKFYQVMASLSLGLFALGILFTVIAKYTGVASYVSTNGAIELGEHIQIPFYWHDYVTERTHAQTQVPSHAESTAVPVTVPDSAAQSSSAPAAQSSSEAADAVAGATSRVAGNYDVYKIDAELGAGEFVLQRGEDFSVTRTGSTGKIDSYTEDGVWKIEGSNSPIPFGSNGKVILTIPEDFYPDELEVELGAGKMTMVDIATKSADITVGAGQIEMKNCTFENADFECSMGELLFKGTLRGIGSVDCGMGNIEIYTAGNQDDFGYSVDCGMGSVQIAGNDYSGIAASAEQNKNAKNFYTIDCGMGNVEFVIG